MAYTSFSQIGQPEPYGPEAPPEIPQTWSSVANEYDQPYVPPTPTAPQLGTYEVQPAPITGELRNPGVNGIYLNGEWKTYEQIAQESQPQGFWATGVGQAVSGGLDVLGRAQQRAANDPILGALGPAGIAGMGALEGAQFIASPFTSQIARETAQKLGYGETGQEVADILGGLVPFSPEAYRLGRGIYGLGERSAQEAALRGAAPESFQFGRGQAIEEFGGFPRRPVVGAAEEAAGAAGGAVGRVEEAAAGAPIFESTPTLTKLYGVEKIEQGKTRGIGERFGMTGRIRPDDPIVTPAMTVRNEARDAVQNQVTVATSQARNIVRRSGFDFDEYGRIPSLKGIDPSLELEGSPLAPTFRDVAARLPVYEDYLNAQQKESLLKVKDLISPYRKALDEVRAVEESIMGKPSSIDIGSRPDVIDGGFYIPRGVAETPELADIAARRMRGGVRVPSKAGFEKTAEFPSESHGIELGYEYTPVEDAIGGYVKGSGDRAIDRHVANYLLSRVDETGQRIAQKAAASNIRTQGRISLSGLDQYTFPWEMADEAERALKESRVSQGDLDTSLRLVNGIMRGIQATGEMSYLGIQNAVGNLVSPRSGIAATKASAKAWLNAGDEVLGDYIARNDVLAAQKGLPTTQQWAASGLRIGESGTEFQIGKKLPGKIKETIETAKNIPVVGNVLKVPGSLVERSDRGFGVAGDTMRIELANTVAEEYMLKYGRRLTNQELKTIAESANRATGWTGQVLLKNWGEFLNFAPRYLTARVRAVGQLASEDPMKREIARRLIGRYIAIATSLTIAGNYLRGEETDFRPFSGKNGPTYDPREAEYKNPNFIKLRNIMGRDRTLLGPVDALLGTGIAAGSIVSNPTGDPKELAKRMRSVITAPLSSLGLDWLVFRENFQGEPLRLDSEAGIKDLTQRFAPFGYSQMAGDVATAAERAKTGEYGKSAQDIVNGVIDDFFGGRGSKLTPRESAIAGEYQSLLPKEQFSAIPALSWKTVTDSFGDQFALKDYQNYKNWRENLIEETIKGAGTDSPQIREYVTKAIDKHPVSKVYQQILDEVETSWVANNPKEAYDLWVAGQSKKWNDPTKWEPNAQQKKILEAYLSQR
jgi:hypothetical protein